jgi:hypothetical protein
MVNGKWRAVEVQAKLLSDKSTPQVFTIYDLPFAIYQFYLCQPS